MDFFAIPSIFYRRVCCNSFPRLCFTLTGGHAVRPGPDDEDGDSRPGDTVQKFGNQHLLSLSITVNLFLVDLLRAKRSCDVSPLMDDVVGCEESSHGDLFLYSSDDNNLEAMDTGKCTLAYILTQ